MTSKPSAIELEVEVPGTTEDVWTAIATAYLFLISAPLLYWPWAPLAALALALAYAWRRPAMGRFEHRRR